MTTISSKSNPGVTKTLRNTPRGDDSTHSYTEEEKVGFVDYINQQLKNDNDLNQLLPIDPDSMDIVEAVKPGVLLNKLLHDLFPNTTVMDSLITNPRLNVFELLQNHNLCLSNARAAGLRIVSIGAEDLRDGNVTLLFGLLWQIIKHGLLTRVNVASHPELEAKMKGDGGLDEEGAELSAMHPEKLLLRWVNWHLKRAGSDRVMTNFTDDVTDSEIFAHLLGELAPDSFRKDNVLDQSDLLDRATSFLHQCEPLGVRKFLRPADIVAGNAKLNLAFVANLFNEQDKFTSSSKKKDEEKEKQRLEELERQRREMEEKLHSKTNTLEQSLNDQIALVEKFKRERDEWEHRALEAQQNQARQLEQQQARDEELSQLRASLAELTSKLRETEEAAETEAQAAAEAEKNADEKAKLELSKTKAAARDWYEEQRKKFSDEKDGLATKIQEKDVLLRKYRDALLKAREERDARASEKQEAEKRLTELEQKSTEQAAELTAMQVALDAAKADAESAAAMAAASTSATNDDERVAQLEQEIARLRQQATEAVEVIRKQGMDAVNQARQQTAQWQQTAENLRSQLDDARAKEAQANSHESEGSDKLKNCMTELETLKKIIRPPILALQDGRQGHLVKYGYKGKTWNKRLFELKRNVLIYRRDDGSVGDVIDLDSCTVSTPQAEGLPSATSSSIKGFNKPTTFEFVLVRQQHSTMPLRLCAPTESDEHDWVAAIKTRIDAYKTFDRLLKKLDEPGPLSPRSVLSPRDKSSKNRNRSKTNKV